MNGSDFGWLLRLAIVGAVLSCPGTTRGQVRSENGSDAPEVVYLKVPENLVGRYFPPETPIRRLPFEDLDRLVGRVERSGMRASGPIRPVSARHTARWSGALLVGSSTFEVGRLDADRDGWMEVAPWSPRVEPPGDDLPGRVGLYALDDGRQAIWVGIGGRSFRVDWTQPARSGTDGRAFDLELPNVEVESLDLELPEGLIPRPSTGRVRGPTAGSSTGWNCWTLVGGGGASLLRVVDRPAVDAWVSGSTRVEIVGGSAQVRSEWKVEGHQRGSRTLRFRLDPGLELVEAAGRFIQGFEDRRDGEAAVVEVRVAEEAPESLGLSIRAVAAVPASGVWQLPAARPLAANWVGGRTEIRLADGQAPLDVSVRDGVRVVPIGAVGESGTGAVVAFESTGPSTVATLEFGTPGPLTTARVRGTLDLSGERPRLQVTIGWRAIRGPVSDLAFELPEGWTPLSLTATAADAAPVWRVEERPGSGLRVFVNPPLTLDAATPWVVDVEAVREGPTLGQIEAPWVRPVDSTLEDQTWTARLGPDHAARPVLESNIAWLDPAGLETAETDPPDLAWRATEPTARLVLDVNPRQSAGWGRVWAVVRDGVEGRSADWYVEPGPIGPDRTIAVASTGPLDGPVSWRLAGDDSAPALRAEVLDEAGRLALGLPVDGIAWRIEVPEIEPDDSAILHARLDPGSIRPGPIPLPTLSPDRLDRGLVILEPPTDRRIMAKADPGWAAIDPGSARADLLAALGSAKSEVPPGRESAGGLGDLYGAGGGRFLVESEPLESVGEGGLIVEARLVAAPSGSGRLPHRLTLLLEPGGATGLDLTLPEGSTLLECWRDGEPIRPLDQGGTTRIPLGSVGTDGGLAEIVLEYQTSPGRDSGEEFAVGWPGFSLPCLSTSLSVVPASGLVVEPESVDLAASPPLPDRSWFPVSAVVPDRGALAARLDAAGPVEPRLGDWLARVDAGDLPIFVDRASVRELGLGPESGLPTPSGGAVRATLAGAGLTIVPLGGAGLLTSEAAGSRLRADPTALADLARLLDRLGGFETDPSDRYRSVADWLEDAGSGRSTMPASPTLRAEPSRWAAIGRPPGASRVRLRDPTGPRALGAVLAFATVGLAWASRPLPLKWRVAGWGMLTALGLALAAVGRPVDLEVGRGLLAGSIGAVGYRLGTRLRGRSRRRKARGPAGSTLRSRSRLAGVGMVLAGGLGWMVPGRETLKAQPSGAVPPILVLLPYGPEAGPGPPPEVALIRLADYERLETLAGSSPSGLVVGASAIVHNVESDALESLVTDFRLDNPGESAGTWSVPIGGARELTAKLDDSPIVPALVAGPADRHARFEIPPGRHRLEVRREVPDLADAGAPINPAASARFRSDRPDALPIGPTDRLVREAGRSSGESEAVGVVAVWEVGPAGDRLTLRLESDGTPGPPLRLAAEKGLEWVGASEPARVVEVKAGSGRGDELLVDLTGIQGVLRLDYWRPRPVDPVGYRLAPMVETRGVRGLFGVLAARSRLPTRLTYWSAGARVGELEGTGRDRGPTGVGDGVLVGDWNRVAGSFVAIEPSPSGRGVVEPTVDLEVAPGRLGVRVEAILSDPEGPGPLDGLKVELPGGGEFRLTGLRAPGLTAWDRPEPGRLRLRFDGRERGLARSGRTLRIEGWLPWLDRVAGVGGGWSAEAASPWPSWPGMEVLEGRLRIAVGSRLTARWVDPKGLSEVGEIDPALRMAIAGRASYRAAPGAEGRLRVESGNPGLNVSTRSRTVVAEGRADWRAVTRYRIGAGPASTFQVDDPGLDLTVSAPGHRVTVRRERLGTRSALRVDLEPPAWGSAELIFRADLARAPGGFEVPKLVPLGIGQVDSYEVGWEDLSGRRFEVATAEGLRALADPSADPTDPSSPPESRRYRVVSEGWRLAIGLPPGSETPLQDSGDRSIRRVDYEVVLDARGRGFGRARCRFGDGPSSLLAWPMPPGVEPISVHRPGERAAPARLDLDGHMVLEVPEGPDALVEFVFATGAGPDGVAIPWPAQGGLPCKLAIHAPAGSRVEPASASIVAVNGLDWGLGRLDDLGLEAVRLAGRVQAREPGTESALLASLERFEPLAKDLRRREAATRPVSRVGRARSSPMEGRLMAIEARVAEAIRQAGLGSIARMARGLVTDWDRAEARAASGLAAPSTPDWFRFPQIGTSRYFQGTTPTPAEVGPILAWSEPSRSPTASDLGRLVGVGLAVLAVLLSALVGFGPSRWRRPIAWGLVPLAMPAPVLVGLGPVGLTLAATFGFGVGWATSRETSWNRHEGV